MKSRKLIFLLLPILLFGLKSAEEPSPPLSPEDELKTFELAEGLKIELVASEPLVQEPVILTFDEKGRLWVVEMRGFMPDVDGTNETAKVGRISVLEDTNGDGKMDKSFIYADSLVLPRAIAFYQDGVLIAENIPLWFYEDTNGDGKADKRTMVDSTYGGRGLPEHSANGLLFGLDNWLYNAKSSFRYKRQGDTWIKEATEFRGQWGISQDDYGRLFYNYNWSQLHADLVPANYLSRNPNHESTTGIDHGLTIERAIYPIRPNPAVNRGYIPGTLDENGKLREFTSACAPYVYRGNSFPAEFRGNTYVCEPAGNLVKRNIVNENGLLLEAKEAYPGKEFLASTDERFRPVFITSGPDGALYLADMYRGINQHGAYMTEYLRKQTIDRSLDKHINLGRIWRIVPDNYEKPNTVSLSGLSSKELVTYLSDENGWNRETAQRLLVQRYDQSVTKDLEKLIKKSDNDLAKIHALWTLEGLQTLDSKICLIALGDVNVKVRMNALRLLESFSLENSDVQSKVEGKIGSNLNAINEEFALQILLSSNSLSEAYALNSIDQILSVQGASPLLRDAALSAINNREYALLKQLIESQNWKERTDYKEIIFEQLATAIMKSGNASNLEGLFDLLNDTDLDWQKRAVLNGAALQSSAQTASSISFEKQPDLFSDISSFDSPTQEKLAQMQNALAWPGKEIVEIKTSRTIILDPDGLKKFAAGRQTYLTYCSGCHGSDGAGIRRFAPPLAGSDWVTGDPKRLALILMHGIEGPIEVKGKLYDVPDILPVMPSHSSMSGGDIANIMTYIRNEWGHESEPISNRFVGFLRVQSQGKIVPWTASDLNQHMIDSAE